MGSLCRMYAGNRLTSALEQRMDGEDKDEDDLEAAAYELTDWIEKTVPADVIDEIAADLAVNPEQIDFPE